MGSQTQQVNTQTGLPDQKSDLPLESDKVPIVTKTYKTVRTVRKGDSFICNSVISLNPALGIPRDQAGQK